MNEWVMEAQQWLLPNVVVFFPVFICPSLLHFKRIVWQQHYSISTYLLNHNSKVLDLKPKQLKAQGSGKNSRATQWGNSFTMHIWSIANIKILEHLIKVEALLNVKDELVRTEMIQEVSILVLPWLPCADVSIQHRASQTDSCCSDWMTQESPVQWHGLHSLQGPSGWPVTQGHIHITLHTTVCGTP